MPSRISDSASTLSNGIMADRSMRVGRVRANHASSRARRSVERQRAQILGAVEQQVVEADVNGEVAQHLGADDLAVEALLQVGERRDDAVAHDQQLAVEHALELHRLDDLGEAAGDVVGPARVDAPAAGVATSWTRMPSHFHSAR